jgi:glycosyltransferase involved in cell wall biosynthesis
MRVAIDTTYSNRGPSGTGVYVEQLGKALAAQGVEVIELANPDRRPPAGGGVGSLRNAIGDRRWTALELPRQARAAGADVLHHALPAHSPLARLPQVTTVHDLAFERLPECFDRRFRAWAHFSHRSAARRCDAVVVPSRTTADDMRELWNADPARIVVAPHGPGQAPTAARNARDAKYFLYVGDAEPRKNLPLLLEAHRRYTERARDPLPLALAGSADSGQAGVIVHRSPGRDRLAELLGEAAALVHPSLYEGFGLTPLEAMHAGVPVIAANAPGTAEVCGDAALLFDPRNADELAALLERVAGDPQERRRLANASRSRALAFSWEDCAHRHVEAYTLAVRRHRGGGRQGS